MLRIKKIDQLLLAFFCWIVVCPAIAQDDKRPNVLLICIDDLLPILGCYGNPEVISPHIDSLASRSALFTRHYVTVPTCGASRYSLLRSRLPRTTGDLSNVVANGLSNGKREKSAGAETFIEQFRRNGYYTVGIGKISHSPDGYIYPYDGLGSDRKELPNSWDEILFNHGKWGQGWNAFFGYAGGQSRITKKGEVYPYEAADVTDEGYPDGLTATLAEDKLKELARRKQPFLLGIGFFKPHLPFNAPRKYWNLYQEEQLSLTPTPDLPHDVHPASLHQSNEFNQYKLGEKASLERSLTDGYARKLIHGYYACISYIDQQVGRLLKTLKSSGLDKNTIVVLWSDHGWHLGDYRVWGKHTLFDRSLRSVLLVHTPSAVSGKKIDRVVSAIDIGPTLLDLCTLPHLPGADGRSMVPLLNDAKDKAWKDIAYSYYRNGVTMVTPRYRLTHYFRNELPVTELYDHHTDPLETNNVADKNPELVKQLNVLWKQGNTGLFK